MPTALRILRPSVQAGNGGAAAAVALIRLMLPNPNNPIGFQPLRLF